MATINPYLNFDGNTEEAFRFYRSVFGTEFITVQRFKDTPEESKLPESARDKIMHISLPIGNGNILMGTDALEELGHPLTVGNNFVLSISVDSEAEANKYFNALSVGGKITIPLEKAFWGAYFGAFTDQFGIQWMVNYDYNKKPA